MRATKSADCLGSLNIPTIPIVWFANFPPNFAVIVATASNDALSSPNVSNISIICIGSIWPLAICIFRVYCISSERPESAKQEPKSKKREPQNFDSSSSQRGVETNPQPSEPLTFNKEEFMEKLKKIRASSQQKKLPKLKISFNPTKVNDIWTSQ